MRFPTRRKVADAPPGVTLKVHSHRDLATLLERDLEGSLVVIDLRDLDAETARRLVDRRPYAVLNAAEFISGRYANLGPRLLAEQGVALLEGDRDGVQRLEDHSRLRLDGSTLYDGFVVALDVRPVTSEQVEQRMEAAQAGLTRQLETFAHTASEFLRREADALLHGHGIPVARTEFAGKPVVVVGPGTQPDDLKAIRAFLREQKPVVITVDAGAEAAVARGLRPQVAILSGAGTIQPRTLGRCQEIVVTGPGDAVRRRAEKANVPIQEARTGMAGMDLGLLMAQRGKARLVVPVGYPSTLEDFIDRDRSAQASNVMTRLRVGSVLVEASAVPLLYTGRIRRWQVAALLVVAVAVLAVAVATTPIGNTWWQDIRPHLPAGLGR